jgi:cell division protein FtsQ
VFLKVALAIVLGVLFFAGYRAAASASFFELRNVEVQGASRVSSDEVQKLVRHEVEKTGVWKADLNAINSRLEHLPWVRTAVVSRVLPDGMRVRIVERSPRAVVRTPAGHFRWVDDEAVLLGEMLPSDQIPSFFLRGLSEDDSESARRENRERVQKFLDLQRDWDAAGLSERVSEVNLMDLRDVRVQLAGENSQIEVRLGSKDQSGRLKGALNALDQRTQMANGSLISYIDMNLGTRAIVGFTSGAHTTSNASASDTASTGARATADGRGTMQSKARKNSRERPTDVEKKSNKPVTASRKQ